MLHDAGDAEQVMIPSAPFYGSRAEFAAESGLKGEDATKAWYAHCQAVREDADADASRIALAAMRAAKSGQKVLVLCDPACLGDRKGNEWVAWPTVAMSRDLPNVLSALYKLGADVVEISA
jgi:hypothetical protein